MTEVLSINSIVTQKEGNIVSDMDGEKVMLSITNGKYYNLGQVGGDIWILINEPISVQQVIEAMQASYDVDANECAEQVTTFLKQLVEEDLIQVQL